MNKREDFRAVMFRMKSVAHKGDDIAVAEIENLSGTGAAILLPYDFFETELTVEFKIGKKVFERKAEVVTKKSMESGHVRYHLKFVDQTERMRSELHSTLITLEASRVNPN